MPIVVQCQCGKRFQAPDTLAGKQVACPSCRAALAVPTPLLLQAAPAAPPIPVTCGACGSAFAAPAHLVGQTVHCPRCRNPLHVGAAPLPASDPFAGMPMMASPPPAFSAPSPSSKSAPRSTKRARPKVAGKGGILFSMLGGIVVGTGLIIRALSLPDDVSPLVFDRLLAGGITSILLSVVIGGFLLLGGKVQ